MAYIKFFRDTSVVSGNASWPMLLKPDGRHRSWCFPKASDAAIMQ